MYTKYVDILVVVRVGLWLLFTFGNFSDIKLRVHEVTFAVPGKYIRLYRVTTHDIRS